MAQQHRSKGPKRSTGENFNQPSPPNSNSEEPENGGNSVFRLFGVLSSDQTESLSFLCKTERCKRDASIADEAQVKSKVKIEIKAEFSPGMARSGRPIQEHSVFKDDLIEIEFENSARLWLRADQYRERFAGPTARDALGSVQIEVPEQLELLPLGMQARGPISWAVKSLKVIGVDLAGLSAKKVAKEIESRGDPKNPKRPGPGLYQCALDSQEFQLKELKLNNTADQSPYLIFIHGTASSTWSSFGDLWTQERRVEREALGNAYGDRVLAFEHRSLTKSPIKNALELAKKLPAKAHLHLITHSRGGLVGEFMCRADARRLSRNNGSSEEIIADPFVDKEYELFETDKRYLESEERLLLEKLNHELKIKQFKIDRFVRVACPALGTTLASGRLDRWFSLIGSLAGAALPETPLFDMFKDLGDFVAAVIKKRTDPATLPGLEAMMPDSACIKLINWPGVTIPGDLAVVAGDIDPEAWWAKLLILVADRFYDGDHDLVVNTPSMYGGTKHSGKAVVGFHKAPQVNHFRYFQNATSARQIISALTAKDLTQVQGFESLQKPTVDIARAIQLRSVEPRPVVFVIPGIMGSELEVDGDYVWLDIPDIMFGGFKQLEINAENVKATQPFARYYGDIIKYLAKTHKVIPFPFDWRLKIETEADRLAIEVRREFDQTKPHRKPVRVLAHSMGGLVARTMIARHGALWNEVCSVDGARLVMLGTPNGGSHAITELLVAQSSTLKQIAMLDFTHDKKELLEIICRFPGVLAMLPKDYREDYFSMTTWNNYHTQAGQGWVLPNDRDIAAARSFRQTLENSPIDPQHMIYVAGHADVTVAEMYLDNSGKKPEIKFFGSIRGDGRVLWDTGIPSGVPTWYMDVEHGDLPANSEAFDALFELLAHGSTSLLPQNAPVSRALAEVRFPMPPAADMLYPDQEVLAASALGASPTRWHRTARRQRLIQVDVAHGNLAYAKYPVAVGHYVGDAIVSAEQQIDQNLGGLLSQRYRLGIYPQALEANTIFFNPTPEVNSKTHLEGAIVVGLGTAGSLSATGLKRTFTRAMLEYAIEAKERSSQKSTRDAADKFCELGVSVLLIGAGAGGIGVKDSVFAILQAIKDANQHLDAAGHFYWIKYLQFIELYEDRALQAAKALNDLKEMRGADGSYFNFAGVVETIRGSLRRASYEEPAGWWHPLQILGGARKEGFDDQTLRFSAPSRRARAEMQLLGTQRALVDQFIAQSIRTTRNSRSTARTLFELLLPNELKAQAPDQENMMLILDEEAARYPWELLEDPWNRSALPFVIEHGLLRQLESDRPREFGTSDAQTKKVLVIGDPVSPYPELKGAQEEAHTVTRTLQQTGLFTVEQLVRPDTQQVVNALYADSYRILHLAGHGVYQMPAKGAVRCSSCGQSLSEDDIAERRKLLKPLTGMIIGSDVVLSPQEVHQMRHVPELVFINCCYLGYIEDQYSAEGNHPALQKDYNKIAANVANEFIQMGVRAVIAAGWAVDDGAAHTFAATFYDAMMRGKSFGESVREARKETFERHRETNTWGAYQCYGDPDYRLVRESEDGETKTDRKLLSPSDAAAQLDNITAGLAIMAGADTGPQTKQIQNLEKEIKGQKWDRDGRLCAALGRAYGEARQFEDGIKWYKRAVAADDAEVRLKDIEQLANLEIRWAVDEWKKNKISIDVKKKIDCGIRRMQALIEWLQIKTPDEGDPRQRLMSKAEPAGPTAERLSILGSACKWKALINEKEKERLTALKMMSRYYEEAFERKKNRGNLDCYPLLNWITAELAVSWQNKRRKESFESELKEKFQAWTIQATQEIEAMLAKQKDFWNEAMKVDFDLLQSLLNKAFDENMAEWINGQYMEAKKRGSPREFESVIDHIEFLLEMARPNASVAKALAKLFSRLTQNRADQKNRAPDSRC